MLTAIVILLTRENLLVKVPFPARSGELNERTSGNNCTRIDSNLVSKSRRNFYQLNYLLEISINETRSN